MKRHYYISEDISELENVERELEANGFTRPQIHILSENDLEMDRRNVNKVDPFLKKDLIISTEIGALIGLAIACLILGFAYVTGLAAQTSWVPFVFLSIVLLGFCTWEGGLIGMHLPHRAFKRFQHVIKQGKHVLLVDAKNNQESTLGTLISAHPRLEFAGTGKSTPAFVISAQNNFKSFTQFMP